MYSGDEFYGDEITSPIERPTYDGGYNGWIGRVDAHLSYHGLVHQDIAFGWYATWQAGHSPIVAARMALAKRARPLPMNGTDFHKFGEC